MSEEIKTMFKKVDPNKSIDNEPLDEPTELKIFKENAEYLLQTCESGNLPVDEKGEPIDILRYLAKLISDALKIEYNKKNTKEPYSNPLRLLQKYIRNNSLEVMGFLNKLTQMQNQQEYLKNHEKKMIDEIERTVVAAFKLGMDYGINIKKEDEKK